MNTPALATVPAQNFMSVLDWLIIVAYFGVILWVGMRVIGRQTSTDHYFVANHKIPGWAAGISMFSTLLSSFTFIAFPGWAFAHDWQVLMREAMAPIAVIFCAILIIPIYRAAIRMSAYEYLEKRFGYVGRLYGTTGFVIGHFIKTGVVLFTLSIALQAVTGIDQSIIIFVLGITTLAFTFVGGIEGVVWTEVIQGGLMLFGGAVIIGFLFFLTDQPFDAASTAWEGGKFKMVDFNTDLTQEGVWVFVLVGLHQFVSKYTTDQTMVQRYLLAPTVKQAIKGTLLGLFFCIIAWLVFFSIGSMLWGFYELHPERLGNAITEGDQILPYFIGKELPIGLTGLVLTGLFASAQSTISGDLNCLGACITSDFYLKIRPAASEKHQLRIAKLTVLLAGFFMIIFAIAMQRYSGGIVEFTLDMSAIVGSYIPSGLLALFLMGFFTRRATNTGMYFGLIIAAIFTTIALATMDDKIINIGGFAFHFWLLPLPATFIAMAIAYFSSITFLRGSLAPIELTVFGHRSTLPWHQSLRNFLRND